MSIRIIGAGAGSGKTERLAKEVYHAIVSGTAKPSGIILTTFTRKAASELMSRVSQKLIDEGRVEDAHLIRQSLIGTVNSVCGQLLLRFAFEAGLPVNQHVLPEKDEQQLFNTALSSVFTIDEARTLDHLDSMLSIEDTRPGISSPKQGWQTRVLEIVKAARNNRISSSQFSYWAHKSKEFAFRSIPNQEGSLTQLLHALKTAYSELKKVVESGKDTQKNTCKTLEALTELVQVQDQGRQLTWQQINKCSKLKAGTKKYDSDAILHSVRLLASGHHTWQEFRSDVEQYIELIFQIAGRVLERYQEFKKEQRLVDYTDQEALTLDMLESNTVCEQLSETIDLILVDEFQDTSPIQLALFLRLSEIVKESVWVGDPKQAIYGFRDTDPELMLETVKTLEKTGLGRKDVPLESSYRSVQPLVEFSNDVFTPMFKNQGMSSEEIQLDTFRKDTPATASLETWVIQRNGSRDNKTNDFSSMASQCVKILKDPTKNSIVPKGSNSPRPLRPCDIAVLSRTNDECDQIALILSQRGIPVSRTGPGLLNTTEVLLVISVLQLMDNPDDTLASANIVWILDVLTDSVSPEIWLSKRLTERDKQKKPVCSETKDTSKYGAWTDHDVIKRIRDLAPAVKSMTPIEALTRAIEMSGVERIIQKSKDPRQAGANLDRLEALCREYEEHSLLSGTSITISGMLQYLARLKETEDDTIGVTGADAVTVSTWHKAKGLEWPVVILYGLDTKPRISLHRVTAYSTDKLDIRHPLASRGLRYIPNPYSSTGPFTEILTQTEEHCSESDNAWRERIRVMYVLFTRARDRLIFVTREQQPKGLETPFGTICTLPTDTSKSTEIWSVLPVQDTEQELEFTEEYPWYPYSDIRTDYPNTVISPSELTLDSSDCFTAGKVETISDRISMNGKADMEKVGTTLHRYLAVDTVDIDTGYKIKIADRLITAAGFKSIIKPEEVVRSGDSIIMWIRNRWNGASLHREWPLTMMQDDGRVIEGIADLVVEMEDSFTLIDYKSFPGSKDSCVHKALSYGQQLSAYESVISKALDKKCSGTFICFAVLGCVVEVRTKK